MMRRILVLVALLAIVVAACGVDTQDQPVEVDRDSVPFGLLESTTTTGPAGPGRSVVVYFVSRPGLVPVNRATDSVPTPGAAFQQLLAGPTVAESRAGLVSEVPDEGLRLVGIRDGLARVRFSSDFDTQQRVAVRPIGQIVLTLTEFATVDRVAFTVGDDRVEVPRGDGSVSTAPVLRDDYTNLLAP
jgi:spore germination protein GerM